MPVKIYRQFMGMDPCDKLRGDQPTDKVLGGLDLVCVIISAESRNLLIDHGNVNQALREKHTY
jgi:hypothetical protein